VIAAHKPHHAADEAAEEKENGRAASA